MTKRLKFDVQVVVGDDISEGRAREVIESMLEDALQDDEYHEVLVIDDGTKEDDAVLRLLDILDRVSEGEVDRAIESLEELERVDEDE